MGTLIHSYETKGPAEIPAKRDYLTKVWLRKVRQMGHEVQVPDLPFNSLYALRLASEQAWSDKAHFPLWNLTGDFFSLCWERGQDLGAESVLLQVLQKYTAEKDVLVRATDKDVRRALKSNLKQAKASGVFGVPTWVIGEEIFWGEDSFESLKGFLQGEELYDAKLLQEFNRSFEPSTYRKDVEN
mgnify:CR=1 FL=1